jgi:hypothetical protein
MFALKGKSFRPSLSEGVYYPRFASLFLSYTNKMPCRCKERKDLCVEGNLFVKDDVYVGGNIHLKGRVVQPVDDAPIGTPNFEKCLETIYAVARILDDAVNSQDTSVTDVLLTLINSGLVVNLNGGRIEGATAIAQFVVGLVNNYSFRSTLLTNPISITPSPGISDICGTADNITISFVAQLVDVMKSMTSGFIQTYLDVAITCCLLGERWVISEVNATTKKIFNVSST